MNTDCEATNPDSTISCNESPFPNLLYNRISDGEKLWGHDGKGVVFADSENLINGNPQLKTAKRGDTLKFSVAIEAENYYDDAKTDPITGYMLGSLNSCGLAVDSSSAEVRVNNQAISPDAYNVELYDIPKEEAEQAGYDFCNEFTIMLDWVNESDTPLYAEGSTIEFTYEATIEDDAPSEVFGRGVYIYDSKAGHLEYSSTDFMTNTAFQATAMLDGNILIRRVDASGNPLAGAKYTVDGVRANKIGEFTYVYDENGSVSEYETGADGKIIISGLPIGEYIVHEISSPSGHEPEQGSLVKALPQNMVAAETGGIEYVLDLAGSGGQKTTFDAITLANGKKIADGAVLGQKMSWELTYDENEGSYKGGLTVKRDGDTFIIPSGQFAGEFTYDDKIQKYILDPSMGSADPSYYYLEFIDDDTIKVHGAADVTLSRENDTDCYSAAAGDGWEGVSKFTLCKNDNKYRLMGDNVIVAYYVHDDELGKWILEDNGWIVLAIEEVSDTEMLVNGYMHMLYDEELDKYALVMPMDGGFNMLVDYRNKTVLATEYLFRDKTGATPDSISNPQTSDAVLKAVIIATIGLVPAFILRKQLTKRTN